MTDSAPRRVADATPSELSIGLIDGFAVRHEGRPVALPQGERRLVAYLAIKRKPLSSTHLTAVLWTDLPAKQASACLRSTTHRILRRVPGLLERRAGRLVLPPTVEIDIEAVDRAVSSLLHPTTPQAEPAVSLASLTGELLPGWIEDWVFVERERLRQRLMHALDRMATLALEEGSIAKSIDAALASVGMEPLRETPRRVLVAAHLAEGNISEALREYEKYADILDEHLGIEPTEQMKTLLGGWGKNGG